MWLLWSGRSGRAPEVAAFGRAREGKKGSHPKSRGTASQEGTQPWAGMNLAHSCPEGRSESPGGGRGGVDRFQLNLKVCPSGSISEFSSIFSTGGAPTMDMKGLLCGWRGRRGHGM